MAACTKVAAFGALMRLLYVGFGADRWSWLPMLWIIAILTMLVGSILAVVQTDVKRMLAYSSVAHTGFLLTGVIGVQAASALGENQITSLQAVLFYLVTYGPATIGTFAIVTLVRDSGGEATSFAKWAGLGRRSPLVAGAFGFLLLSMAGIPLTGGFVGKWAVFEVAFAAGAWPVVLTAIVASIISVFFYVRVILLMFFDESEAPEKADDDHDRGRRGRCGGARDRGPDRGRHGHEAVAADVGDHRRLRRGDPAPGHRAGAGARPGGECRTIHQVTPDRRGLALPVTDPALEARLRTRLEEVEKALTATCRAGSRSSPRPRATCSTPAASGSGRCWCCSPPRPARTRTPTRCSPRRASSRSPTSARSTTTTSWTRPRCAAARTRPTPAGTTWSRS